MKPFDRPPLPGAVRLMAALDREGLRPVDLVDVHRVKESPFLRSELRRFCRNKNAEFSALLAEARTKLLSQPVYFVWDNSESSVKGEA